MYGTRSALSLNWGVELFLVLNLMICRAQPQVLYVLSMKAMFSQCKRLSDGLFLDMWIKLKLDWCACAKQGDLVTRLESIASRFIPGSGGLLNPHAFAIKHCRGRTQYRYMFSCLRSKTLPETRAATASTVSCQIIILWSFWNGAMESCDWVPSSTRLPDREKLCNLREATVIARVSYEQQDTCLLPSLAL